MTGKMRFVNSWWRRWDWLLCPSRNRINAANFSITVIYIEAFTGFITAGIFVGEIYDIE